MLKTKELEISGGHFKVAIAINDGLGWGGKSVSKQRPGYNEINPTETLVYSPSKVEDARRLGCDPSDLRALDLQDPDYIVRQLGCGRVILLYPENLAAVIESMSEAQIKVLIDSGKFIYRVRAVLDSAEDILRGGLKRWQLFQNQFRR